MRTRDVQEWKAHQLKVLDQVGCGGKSFLANDDQNKNKMYFILLLGSVGLLLVILAMTAIIVHKNMRLSEKVRLLYPCLLLCEGSVKRLKPGHRHRWLAFRTATASVCAFLPQHVGCVCSHGCIEI